MNDHWQSKMKRSKGMSNLRINNLYEHLMKNGCIGGKLIETGGGGYLLMLCKNKKALNELNYKGYHNTTCSLDNEDKIINFKLKIFQAVIICGGLASRLGNKSKNIPKSLIKIKNKPFLHYQLKYLEKNKIKKLFFALGTYTIRLWIS